MVLETIENAEFGLTIRICKHVKGFSVTIQDADSGEFLPTIRVFPTQVDAAAFAASLVK